MEFSCSHCNTTTTADIHFEVKEFVCPNCRGKYHPREEGLKFKGSFSADELRYEGIKPGQKGILKGVEYTVTGSLMKRASHDFYWIEYTLNDKDGNFIYLSEAEGHWILLKEVEDAYEINNKPRYLHYNDRRMNLYERSDAAIASAQGFFDFEIPKRVSASEFIAPPFMISLETMDNVQRTFFGEHIRRREIKKAFPDFEMPAAKGIGMVQPFPVNIYNLGIVLCVSALLILFSQWFIYMDRQQQLVLDKTFTFDEYNNRDYVSQAFELKGGTAPLTIAVNSSVDNSWANVQVTLVDEKASEEVYTNKDIEYYHGYAEGESWTEGNQTEEFNICGVKPGKYHLVITPQKAPEDYANNFFMIRVTWGKSSMRNVWLCFLFMGVSVLIAFYTRHYFERKRWETSDYSTFD